MPLTISVSSGDEKPSAQRHPVDENLKKIYDGLIDDEVPDRFADLLRKLREREERK